MPSRIDGRRPKSVLICSGCSYSTSTCCAAEHPANKAAVNISQRRSMAGSSVMLVGGSRVGSVVADDLAVVPDGEPVEDDHGGRTLQDRHVAVGEGELAD